SVSVGDSLVHAPLITGPGATACVALAAPDRLVTLDLADGSTLGGPETVAGGWSTARPRVQPAGDGARLVVFTVGGWHSLPAPGSAAVARFEVAFDRGTAGRSRTAVTGDLVAVFDDLGLVGAWDADGARTGAADPAAPLVAEPAVADVDGDGNQDLVLATAERLLAGHADGVAMRGFPARLFEMFPLPDSTRLAGPLLVADQDGDGVNEIICGTDRGHLLSLSADGRLRDRFPFLWGDRAGSGFAIGEGGTAGAGRVLWLASQGGYAGEPFGRNLTGGRLTALRLAPAAALAARTSEWTAAAGGAARTGPVGEPRSLGPLAPAAAEANTALLYPNPVTGDAVTVRLAGPAAGTARLTLYNLQGEILADVPFAVTGGQVAEHTVALPGVASGLYVCRLQWPTGDGRTTRTMTLAVER
ncbi:MAG: T9SS type A sorting domain-containing protein, partial [Candidatus Krumholzibacteriia bacterium]